MKTLKSILNERFSYLAFGIILIFVCMQYFSIRSTYEFHKNNAIDSTKILADYFEPTIIFESVPDFNALAEKLDFKDRYRGITLYDKSGKLFASRGELVEKRDISEIVLRERRLFTKESIFQDGDIVGTLYISFTVNKLENDLIFNILLILLILLFVSVGFYLYVKQLNQLVISPINQIITAIHRFGGPEELHMGSIKSEITEIHELKENFSNLISQLNFSKNQLEHWNKNLEETVEDKTKKLTEALEETKKYQRKIIAQEKLASLGGLSAGIAHEIKNPLNLIINSSQLVTMKLETLTKIIRDTSETAITSKNEDIDEEILEINEICDIINSSGKRADRIIKGMLSQARSQSSRKERQNLTEICRQGLNLAYHAMRAKDDVINITVIDRIKEGVFHVCYGEEIERALINLLDNAFDSLKEKKDKCPEFVPEVTVSLFIKENDIIITVEDNGVGIPQDIIEKVKEPFFTTKPTGKGTGLGISMINDIVTSQSGELIILSKLGKYTKMVIKFPCLTDVDEVAS
ncbi:MAG: signal transduction histidine kinase [Bacteriovoracaceae bacterium]|jgi:two-component system NtrC family sensor kinase